MTSIQFDAMLEDERMTQLHEELVIEGLLKAYDDHGPLVIPSDHTPDTSVLKALEAFPYHAWQRHVFETTGGRLGLGSPLCDHTRWCSRHRGDGSEHLKEYQIYVL